MTSQTHIVQCQFTEASVVTVLGIFALLPVSDLIRLDVADSIRFFRSDLTHHSRLDSAFTIQFDSDLLILFDSHCTNLILIQVTASDPQ